MKRFYFLTILLLLLPVGALSQEPRTEIESLQAQIPNEISMGNIDTVVKLAEKIADLEKAGGSANISKYVAALTNVALWKRQWLDHVVANRTRLTANEFKKISSDETRSLEQVFRTILAILETDLNEPLQLASTKSEFARFIFRYKNSDVSRKEVESLMNDSLKLYEVNTESDSESTIAMIRRVSEFYYETGEFEKYLNIADRYISATEKKFGKDSNRLVPVLRLYASTLVTLDRENEMKEVIARIAGITGADEPAPLLTNIILLRSVSKLDLTIGFTGSQRRVVDLNYPLDPSGSGARFQIWQDSQGISQRSTSLPDLPSAGNRTNPGIGGPGLAYNIGTVVVYFVVDESGSVIEVTSITKNEKLRKKVSDLAKNWKFRPFIYQGKAGKMRGAARIRYFL